MAQEKEVDDVFDSFRRKLQCGLKRLENHPCRTIFGFPSLYFDNYSHNGSCFSKEIGNDVSLILLILETAAMMDGSTSTIPNFHKFSTVTSLVCFKFFWLYILSV